MDNKKELEALDPTNASSTVKTDTVTPHKISIVLLVQQYLKAKSQATDDGVAYPPQTRRKFCMLLLKLIQYPDMSYNNLHSLLTSPKYKIDSNHLEGFEKCLRELSTSGIEHLLDLIDVQSVMDKMLSEASGVSQYGIVGLFCRRIVLTLDRASFPEMMTLYKSITFYYDKGIRSLNICPNGTQTEEESIMDTHLVLKDRNGHSKWSIKQAELFIAQQCSLLETNEVQALPPIEMYTKLSEIIQDNPLFSPAHFLNYMNNLRLRDFLNSLDALHRTFDRSPVQTSHPAETRGFQYSSLNLAIMHTNFNHKKEALASLKECIMLAQECGDKHCLELANSWYCILNSDSIKPMEKTIPEQTEFVSLSVQFFVKIAALYGLIPSEVFKLLLKSDELNCRNSLMELVANSLGQRAALWTLYGKNELSSLCGQVLLKLNKTWAFGDIGNSDGICQVLCSLALWLSIQGEFALCGVVLHHARERFPREPHARSWMICDNYVTINQSIYKCKWQEGIKACCQLYVLDANTSILQRSALLIAKRNLPVARQMLDTLLRNKNLEPLTQVRANILLAYSMIHEDHIAAQIVEILSRASVFARQKYLEYEAAIIDMIFAHVLLHMKMPQQALKTIKSCMEIILANGGIYDRAKTIFLFAKCLVASSSTKQEKLKRISESLDMILEAVEYFKKLEAHSKVKDVYIFLAKFYNEMSAINDRNHYACKFKQYDLTFPTPVEYLNVFF